MDESAILRTISGALNYPVFALDREFRYRHFNPAHAAAMKAVYGADIALGQPLAAYQTSEDWAVAQVNLEQALAGETVIVSAYSGDAARERQLFDILHVPIRDGAGAVVGVAVMAQNVVDESLAAEAVRAGERRFRALIENSADAIAVLNAHGVVVYDSPSAPGLLGYGPEEWIGKSVFELLHPADLLDVRSALTQLAARPGGRTERVFRLRHKDGHWMWMEGAATNLLAEPNINGIVVNYRDITARVQAEEQLRAANRQLEAALAELHEAQAQLVHQERLAAVGRLAAGIAHDFNNILAGILLNVQLSLRAEDLPDGVHRRLELVAQQSQRGAGLVQQILDFGRNAMLQTQAVEIWPFLEEQAALMQELMPQGMVVTLNGEPIAARVQLDPIRIQQLLINLAYNARDAMGGKGELQLAADLIGSEHAGQEADQFAPHLLPELQQGHWLRLVVQDTGSGIAPSVLPHIFEPFFTTKEPGQGTGLGLAQVYGIVRQHRGHIAVRSKEGGGATFIVLLPYEPA